MAKPFLRWVGGKSWLVPKLVPEILAGNPQIYVEPFLGAGAIALALPDTLPKILGDTNAALMDVWRCLQRVPDALHTELTQLEEREHTFWGIKSSIFYNEIRAEFNAMVGSSRSMWVARAARFVFLNARCFNGLWRTNKAGRFNVPWGKLESPRRHLPEDFKAYCAQLGRAQLHAGHFLACGGVEITRRSRVAKDDFEKMKTCLVGVTAFFDSPYDQTFDDYAPGGFGEADQRQLASHAASWAAMGARIFATNTDTPLIRELYAWAHVEPLNEQHSVSATNAGRGKRACLLIRAN